MAIRLRLVLSRDVLELFFQQETIPIEDIDGIRLANTERDSMALLMMLASVGEFFLFTGVSELKDLVDSLEECTGSPVQNNLVRALEHFVAPVPLDSVQLASALKRQEATGLPFSKALLAEAARSVHAHALISLNPSAFESRGIVALKPTEFFHLLEERYGISYAETAL